MDRKTVLAELRDILHEPIGDFIPDSYIEAEAVYLQEASKIGKPAKGLPIARWSYLTEALGGFPPNQFSIVCGPSGAGKTTLLASWALDLFSAQVPVYIASIELGAGEFMKKMMSAGIGKNIAEVPYSEREQTTKNMYPILGTSMSVFAKYDTRVSHTDMLTDILHAHRTKGIKIAMVDNINYMMEVKRGTDQNLEMDRAVHDFVVFCKKIPIHIIMVMHPRKTENGRVTSMFDVKGSATSVQESANVLLFNRLDKEIDAPIGPFGERYEHKYCRELLIEKSRFNGRAVGQRIIMAIEKQSEYLKELGRAAD